MSEQYPDAVVESRDPQGTGEPRRSRRQILRLAGVAGAAGAVALVGQADPANAANGDPITIGTSNAGTSSTSLTSPSGLGGVLILTATDQGPGLSATGSGGGDVKCAGTGRLSQAPAVTGKGAPTFVPIDSAGNSVYHELVRSDTGILWASRGLFNDTANRWKRVNAVRIDAATGTGAVYVPSRLVDTRTGGGTPLSAGSTFTTGVAGDVSLPADTVAVFGNLTAVAPTAGGFASPGFLTVFPTGSTQPVVSNVNPSPTGQNAFPNFFFCGLGTSGQLSVFTSVQTHLLIDIFAYVQ